MEFTLKKIEKLCIKGFLELKQKKDASNDLTDLDIFMEYTDWDFFFLQILLGETNI